MLQLSPAETIIFQKNSNNELIGNVHILNASKKAVTYKVIKQLSLSLCFAQFLYYYYDRDRGNEEKLCKTFMPA